MGEIVVLERRKQMSECYVGEDYYRPNTLHNCPCAVDDFEWYGLLIFMYSENSAHPFALASGFAYSTRGHLEICSAFFLFLQYP